MKVLAVIYGKGGDIWITYIEIDHSLYTSLEFYSSCLKENKK